LRGVLPSPLPLFISLGHSGHLGLFGQRKSLALGKEVLLVDSNGSERFLLSWRDSSFHSFVLLDRAVVIMKYSRRYTVE